MVALNDLERSLSGSSNKIGGMQAVAAFNSAHCLIKNLVSLCQIHRALLVVDIKRCVPVVHSLLDPWDNLPNPQPRYNRQRHAIDSLSKC